MTFHFSIKKRLDGINLIFCQNYHSSLHINLLHHSINEHLLTKVKFHIFQHFTGTKFFFFYIVSIITFTDKDTQNKKPRRSSI